jgi:hypothetical protein
MHTLASFAAGIGVIFALMFLPAVVRFTAAAQPRRQTYSACWPAPGSGTRIAYGVVPSGAAHDGLTMGTVDNGTGMARLVKSSARTQRTLLKMVELGLYAARGDDRDERRRLG